MSLARHLLHPRDELLKTMERIYRFRMTTMSGGNLSIREENGDVWITPARVDKGNLKREDIIRVLADGTTEGPHRPSSELPFHRAIYAARPDLRAIVHAHPVALVAFSICQRIPETQVVYQARRICGDPAFADYALPGSEELGRNIARAFATGANCVVLENHGVATAGDSLQSAFDRFEALEFAAKTLIKGRSLGEVRFLTDSEIHAADRPIIPSTLIRTDAPTSHEKELRKQLCDFVRRCYQQRLMISTQGAFSARVDEQSFLITPHQHDRFSLEIDDLVLVRNGTAEAGKSPSRSTVNHSAIYAKTPHANALVHAYPVNATAFSITGKPLNTRTIPESYLFLCDVQQAARGVQFQDGSELASITSLENPILLLQNDGVQVVGTSILDAFDRLEVLEATAEAMIASRPIGDMQPMSDSVIDELRVAFLGK